MAKLDPWGGAGANVPPSTKRRYNPQVPESLDGHASSSPPTLDPSADAWTTMTIAEARAAGVTATTRCLDGWLVAER